MSVMRVLIVLLLAANLLLFGWFRGWMAPYGGDGSDSGRIGRQQAPDRLKLLPAAAPTGASGGVPVGGETPASGAATRSAAQGADAAAPAPGSVAPASLQQAACIEVGPLFEADAVRLQVALDAALPGLRVALSTAQPAQMYWVVLPPAPGDVRRRVDELQARRLPGDAPAAIREGAWKGGVLLGRFREPAVAQDLVLSLREQGVEAARLAPRPPAPARVSVQMQPSSEALLLELSRQVDALPGAASPRACGALSR
jgi:hypothetical protein